MDKIPSTQVEIWKCKALIKGIKLPNEVSEVSHENWTIKRTESDKYEFIGKIQVPYGGSNGYSEANRLFWLFWGLIIGNIPEIVFCEPWIIDEFKITLDNSSDLARQNLPIPTVVLIKQISTINMSQESLKNLVSQFNKLISLNNNEAKILKKILHYMAKSQTQENVADRFIWNWLGLTLIYNSLYPNIKKETKRVKALANVPRDEAEIAERIVNLFISPRSKKTIEIQNYNLEVEATGYETLAKLLIDLKLKGHFSKKNRSQNLQYSIENKDPVRVILMNILLCLYTVRSQLLHGNPEWLTQERENYLQVLSKGLGYIITFYIYSFAKKSGLQ